MITESYYWKKPLLAGAKVIRKYMDVEDISDAQFARIEREIFIGFYSIRKLLEATGKVSAETRDMKVTLKGVDAYRKLAALNLPANMGSMLLPDLDEFGSFPARGPQGVSLADINGRAAAIECYLDLDLPAYGPAQVLWSNYKKDIDAWHGALEFKESYQRRFYDQSDDALRNGPYKSTKLANLLDALIRKAALVSPVA